MVLKCAISISYILRSSIRRLPFASISPTNIWDASEAIFFPSHFDNDILYNNIGGIKVFAFAIPTISTKHKIPFAALSFGKLSYQSKLYKYRFP